jgi:hypothetical protein
MSGGTPQDAYAAASASAVQDDAFNTLPTETFLVAADRTVTLTVVRETPTLVLHYIPRSEEWLVAEATSTHRQD